MSNKLHTIIAGHKSLTNFVPERYYIATLLQGCIRILQFLLREVQNAYGGWGGGGGGGGRQTHINTTKLHYKSGA